MDTTGSKQDGKSDEVQTRLAFFKDLQSIINAIHTTQKLEQILLEISPRICALFECDRLTLYSVNYKTNSIDTKIKTGLATFKDFSLPKSKDCT